MATPLNTCNKIFVSMMTNELYPPLKVFLKTEKNIDFEVSDFFKALQVTDDLATGKVEATPVVNGSSNGVSKPKQISPKMPGYLGSKVNGAEKEKSSTGGSVDRSGGATKKSTAKKEGPQCTYIFSKGKDGKKGQRCTGICIEGSDRCKSCQGKGLKKKAGGKASKSTPKPEPEVETEVQEDTSLQLDVIELDDDGIYYKEISHQIFIKNVNNKFYAKSVVVPSAEKASLRPLNNEDRKFCEDNGLHIDETPENIDEDFLENILVKANN